MDKGKVYLRNVQSNEVKMASERQLFDAIHKGQIVLQESGSPATDLSAFSSSMQLAAHTRHESYAAVATMSWKRKWIEAMRAYGIERLVDEPWVRVAMKTIAKNQFPDAPVFELSTLRAAVRKVQKAQGDWTAIIPRYSERGGRGKARIDTRAEATISRILAETSKGQGRIVKKLIVDEIRDSIKSQNLSLPGNEINIPGASTIGRRVDETLSKFEISVRNHGRKRATKLYRNNALARDVAEFPLLVSEYDDTDCGVFLMDERTGLPHGRAYLTIGVCQNTGVTLGFDLGHAPRSYDSAIGAIADSLLPKDMSSADFRDCKHPWIGYGAQGTILMDNGPYNFSKSMEHQREVLSLMMAGARPYGPTEKCAIEHFNHTFKRDFCTHLPGWRGDKKDPDSVKFGMSNAILSIANFRGLFVRWVTDQYLNKPGEDGLTPAQRWRAHFRHHGPSVRWSSDQVAMLRLRPSFLKFRENGGIEILKLRYWSDELATLRKDIGRSAEVLVYEDPKDCSYVLVQHPRTKALSRIPSTMNPEYVSGLTRYQQALILKFARTQGC